jgi:hypothetical protein
MTLILLAVLLGALRNGATVAACDWADAEEWICVPCGGIYTCHGTGACFADAVPGCTLPPTASDWLCCDASDCDVTSPNPCPYTPPAPPPPYYPPWHRRAGGGLCLGGADCDCALGNIGNACVLTIVVPLLMVGAGVAACCCFCRRKRQGPGEQTGLLNGASAPAYAA